MKNSAETVEEQPQTVCNAKGNIGILLRIADAWKVSTKLDWMTAMVIYFLLNLLFLKSFSLYINLSL